MFSASGKANVDGVFKRFQNLPPAWIMSGTALSRLAEEIVRSLFMPLSIFP
jgi:hypothetical protein